MRSYGLIVAAVVHEGRRPRSRFAGLLIAATVHANGLDLYSRKVGRFTGLEAVIRVVASTASAAVAPAASSSAISSRAQDAADRSAAPWPPNLIRRRERRRRCACDSSTPRCWRPDRQCWWRSPADGLRPRPRGVNVPGPGVAPPAEPAHLLPQHRYPAAPTASGAQERRCRKRTGALVCRRYPR